MAPVSRTTTTPHDIINCKDCLRVRLAQIKNHSNNKAGTFGANDENFNEINIHHASKYEINRDFYFFFLLKTTIPKIWFGSAFLRGKIIEK